MYIENVKIISLQDLLEELKDKELVIDILKNLEVNIIKMLKIFYILRQLNLKIQDYQVHI